MPLLPIQTPESEMTCGHKKNYYFHSSHMVLLRATYFATANMLTISQLGCMTI